jgi:hypothetical protein
LPNIKDAPLILSGQVLMFDTLTDFETKAPTGAKVTVLTNDGVTVVKVRQEHLAALAPIVGTQVVWYVRPTPYSIDGNSGMSVGFVRVVDYGDVDQLGSLVQAAAKK